MAKKKKIVRSDKVYSPLTDKKQEILVGVREAYRRAAEMLADQQWALFYRTGRFDIMNTTAHHAVDLVSGHSQRTYSARRQVVGMLESHAGNAGNRIRGLIGVSDLSPEEKHICYSVNIRRDWYFDDVLFEKKPVPEYLITRLREWFDDEAKNKPTFDKIGMRLGSQSVSIRDTKHADQSGQITKWASISTMEMRNRVAIPLHIHDYADRDGDLIQMIEVCGPDQPARSP